MEIITESAGKTFELGQSIGTSLKGGEVLALFGEMGAGKTTLIQGIASGLGIKSRIVSPTFILLRKYTTPSNRFLYHLDLYRLESDIDREIENLGLAEQWGRPENIVLIEWPEKIKLLPNKVRKIRIEIVDENKRKIIY